MSAEGPAAGTGAEGGPTPAVLVTPKSAGTGVAGGVEPSLQAPAGNRTDSSADAGALTNASEQQGHQPPTTDGAPLTELVADPGVATAAASTAAGKESAASSSSSSSAAGGRGRRKVRSFVPPGKRSLLPGLWDALQQLEQEQPDTAAEAVLLLARTLYPLPGEGGPLEAAVDGVSPRLEGGSSGNEAAAAAAAAPGGDGGEGRHVSPQLLQHQQQAGSGAVPPAPPHPLAAAIPPGSQVLQALAAMTVDTAALLPFEAPGGTATASINNTTSSSSSSASAAVGAGTGDWLQLPLDAWAALQFIQGDVAAFVQAAAVAAGGAGTPAAHGAVAAGTSSSGRSGTRAGAGGVLAPEVVALAAAGGEPLWRSTVALAAAQAAAAGDWEGSAAQWLAVGDVQEALRVAR